MLMKNLRCYKSQQRCIHLEKDLHHTVACKIYTAFLWVQEASGTPSRDGNTGSSVLGSCSTMWSFWYPPFSLLVLKAFSTYWLASINCMRQDLTAAMPVASLVYQHTYTGRLSHNRKYAAHVGNNPGKLSPTSQRGRVLLDPVGCLIHKLTYAGSGRVYRKAKAKKNSFIFKL